MKKKLCMLLTLTLALTTLATGCKTAAKTTPNTASPAAEKKATVKYPTKPIELIVPFAAGGGTDSVGRAFAEALKRSFDNKVEVVVSNKTGGGGSVGMTEGLNAKPDGYTLTMVTREVVSLPLQGQAAFKTGDFRYIGNLNFDPTVIVVSSKSKYQKIEELIADMKANPGKLNFAASVTPNFYALQLTQTSGLTFTTIPFNGAAPAITEILGGRADFGIYGPGEVKAQLDSGNLRALAVMDSARFAGLPNVPTLKEKGIDVSTGTYRGIAVNPKTPDDVCKVLEDAVAKATKDTQFVEFMNKSFLGIKALNAAEFKSYVENDVKVLGPIIEASKKK